MGFAELVTGVDRATQDLLGGVAVTYTPGTGAPPPAAVDVVGMFDDDYIRVDARGGEFGVEEVGPSVVLKLADLPIHPKDDPALRLTISGTLYKVRERKTDGTIGGSIRLLLHVVVP